MITNNPFKRSPMPYTIQNFKAMPYIASVSPYNGHIALVGQESLIMMNRRGWCARFLFKRGEAHRLGNGKSYYIPKSDNITLNERRLNAWTGLYNSIILPHNTSQQC